MTGQDETLEEEEQAEDAAVPDEEQAEEAEVGVVYQETMQDEFVTRTRTSREKQMR